MRRRWLGLGVVAAGLVWWLGGWPGYVILRLLWDLHFLVRR